MAGRARGLVAIFLGIPFLVRVFYPRPRLLKSGRRTSGGVMTTRSWDSRLRRRKMLGGIRTREATWISRLSTNSGPPCPRHGRYPLVLAP